MEVFKYISADGLVEIKMATSDISNSWKRFKARIGESATSYCDYTASRSGTLFLPNIPAGSTSLVPLSEEPDIKWESRHPVMFETNTYSITLRFSVLRAGLPSFIRIKKLRTASTTSIQTTSSSYQEVLISSMSQALLRFAINTNQLDSRNAVTHFRFLLYHRNSTPKTTTNTYLVR